MVNDYPTPNPLTPLSDTSKRDILDMKFQIGQAIFAIEAAISAANDTAKSTDYATELLEKAVERLEATRNP